MIFSEPSPAADDTSGIPDDSGQSESAAESAQESFAAIPTLQEQLEASNLELRKLQDQALRAQAELDNFRKRSQKEQVEIRKYAAVPLIRDLLPGLDNLRRTIDAAEQGSNPEELLQGVNMVLAQFETTLASHNVKPIEAEGVQFDPNFHEALSQIPTADHDPMTILQELERGYKMHDRVIRPGKVIVAAAMPEEG